MKHKSSFLATFACAISLTGLSSAATIVGVDVAGGAYTGIGVLDITSRLWKSITGASGTFDLDGTTVSYSTGGWNGSGSLNQSNNAATDIDLLNDYRHGNNGTITLTGLDTTKTYNIVLYSTQDLLPDQRGGLFTLNTGTTSGTNPQESTGGQDISFEQGVNYVRFDNITASALGTISFNLTPGTSATGIFNGFEIQSVPEPSAALLGGLGVLALLRRRR